MTDISATKGQKEIPGDGNKSEHRGAAGRLLSEDIPNYLAAPCEKVISGMNNTWIVLGRDRPGPKVSGHGGAAETRAGAIDFVVGRVSANVITKDHAGRNIYINPDFKYFIAMVVCHY